MENGILGNSQTSQFTPLPVVKEKPKYGRAEKILSVCTLVLSFCFIRYTVFNTPGFIATGIYFALISAAIIYMKKRECEFSRFNKIIIVILYAFSLVFSITANGFVKFLDIVFIAGAGAYLLYSIGSGNKEIERFYPFALCKAVFGYPFSNFAVQLSIASDSASDSKIGKNIKKIILGLVITVPLTAVVASLLMSADDGLKRMMGNIAERIFVEDLWNIIGQLCLAIPCSLYLFGMFYSNTHRNPLKNLNEQVCVQKLYNVRFVSNLISYTAVTPICVLYVLFFISQANYFLSAFSDSLPDGYTYADYARQGFFELFAVAVINLGVICCISLFSKKAGREKPFALKFYSVLLSVFTLILIATAISKMVMYIDRYGLTKLRVYTSWFMVLLAFVFVMIIIKQFCHDMKLAKNLSVFFVIMFALLCFSRPESLIAKYNIEMYNAGYLEELDTESILRMSDDARLIAFSEGVVSADELNEWRGMNRSFEDFNISSVILNEKMSDS